MIVYKIRDKSTGFYSTGGTHPNWNEGGKIWKRLGDVTSHLNQLAMYSPSHRKHQIQSSIYANSELVEFELTEKELSAKPVINHIIERQEKLRLEAEELEKYQESVKKIKRKKLYQELKEEFEG